MPRAIASGVDEGCDVGEAARRKRLRGIAGERTTRVGVLQCAVSLVFPVKSVVAFVVET